MKIDFKTWSVIIALAIFLAACATSGRQFDTTHVNDVKKGVQTKAQIEAWFGAPFQTSPLQGSPAGCVERWTYVSADASWGGLKAKSEALVVDFDKKGKVCDHAYSQTGK